MRRKKKGRTTRKKPRKKNTTKRISKRFVKKALDVANLSFKNNLIFSWQENDYIDSYFDNGEDFAAGSDDNMDGEATY